ncbi:MAG: hypothetical protein J7K33_11315 [Candidatus Marinimicrobia bacterium]|nr:hypothetical protein [Candidatus Neomarinimicrobiota bacterium]
MQEITLKLPIKVIMEILRRVPRKELEKLQRETREVKSVPASHLTKLVGIASIGGDALEDTERVWE